MFTLVLMTTLVSAVYEKELSLDYSVSCNDINCSQSWNITVQNPNTTILVDNQEMTVGAYYVNYSFIPIDEGTYSIFLLSDESEYYSDTVEVNYLGNELTEGKAIIYVGLFFILVFLQVVGFVGIGLLPRSNTKDEEGKILSVSYLKYFRNTLWMFEWTLLMGILYLGSNVAFAYLGGAELAARILFGVSMMMLAVTPIIVIVWLAWIFRTILHDIVQNRLLKRGIMGYEI